MFVVYLCQAINVHRRGFVPTTLLDKSIFQTEIKSFTGYRIFPAHLDSLATRHFIFSLLSTLRVFAARHSKTGQKYVYS